MDRHSGAFLISLLPKPHRRPVIFTCLISYHQRMAAILVRPRCNVVNRNKGTFMFAQDGSEDTDVVAHDAVK